MMKTVQVEESVWKAAKVAAVERGVTLGALVGEAVLAYLGQRPAAAVMPEPRQPLEQRQTSPRPMAVGRSQATDVTCPKCGHGPAVHRVGAQGNRCERCMTCVWAEVPA